MKTYFTACVAACLALAVIVSGAVPRSHAGARPLASAASAHTHVAGRLARHGSTPWLLRAMSAQACVGTLTTVPSCSAAQALSL